MSEDRLGAGACDYDSDSGHEISSKPKKKTLHSGLYKKSADTVKFPQIWRILPYNLSLFQTLFHS